VSAKDLGTQKEQHITITGSSGLTDEEIEKAKKDAELHAEEDKKLEELVNVKNAAEGLSFSIEKVCKDQKEKLGEELCTKTEAAVAELREAIKTNDIAKIKEKQEALEKLNTSEIVPKIYPAGAQNANAAGGPQMSKEDFDKMMKDPKFAEMFKNMGNFTGNAAPAPEKSDDGVVDAEVSE
jgi:molecular chaperone DnaK